MYLEFYMIQLSLWLQLEKYGLATKDIKRSQKKPAKIDNVQWIRLIVDFLAASAAQDGGIISSKYWERQLST